MKRVNGFAVYDKRGGFEKIKKYEILNSKTSFIGFEKNGLLRHGYLTLSFDGEIYNKNKFKERLSLYGYSFDSQSDGEVVLKALHKWGEHIVSEFEGVFSFALFNSLENRLFIFRDKMGVKPIYYYIKDDIFLFSNSLASFLEYEEFEKSINKNSLALYMRFGYMLEPNTIYENCYKLKSGSYIELDLSKKSFEEKIYWDLAHLYRMPLLEMGEDETIEKAKELLDRAVLKRLDKSFKNGVLLSGGYDSAAIAAFVQKNSDTKIDTFSIAFEDERYDESVYAKKIADAIGASSCRVLFTAEKLRDTIEDFVEAYDEPFGDKAAFATMYILKRMKEKGIDNIFAGDGGDEVFGTGDDIEQYRIFLRSPIGVRKAFSEILRKIEPKEIATQKNLNPIFVKLEKLKYVLDSDSISQMLKHKSQIMTLKEVREIFKDDDIKELPTNFDNQMLKDSNDELNNLLATTIKTYFLDDEMRKVSAAASYYGFGLKEAFLDEELLYFMARVPASLKHKYGIRKYILKEIVHDFIPKDIMNRPKKGLSLPLDKWLKDELKDIFLDYINEERLKREGFFDAKKVIKLRDDYLNGYSQKIVFLWDLFVFELWYERWMK